MEQTTIDALLKVINDRHTPKGQMAEIARQVVAAYIKNTADLSDRLARTNSRYEGAVFALRDAMSDLDEAMAEIKRLRSAMAAFSGDLSNMASEIVNRSRP